jgi:hypothetical protein
MRGATMASPHITYTPSDEVTAEAELAALVATYKFVLFGSQASKGGPHDLTTDPTKKQTTGPEKKGTDNADLHSD